MRNLELLARTIIPAQIVGLMFFFAVTAAAQSWAAPIALGLTLYAAGGFFIVCIAIIRGEYLAIEEGRWHL